MSLRLPVALAAFALAAPSALSQPDHTAPPANGSADLRPGTPYALDLDAGGEGEVENCSGYYRTGRPDLNLRIQDSRPVRMYVRSSRDTVLLVRTPSGEVLCNDDTDGTNPAVDIEAPAAGTYAVWVGTFGQYEETAPATFYAGDPIATVLDLGATPATSARLRGGFTPDPYSATVDVGGPVVANAAADLMCSGFVSVAPAVNLNYDGDGSRPLYLYARAQNVPDEMGMGGDDLTLAVNLPDGTWMCNDDAGGEYGLDPGVKLERAMSGLYQVWVGTLSSRARTETTGRATFYASETTGPEPMEMEDFMMEDFPEGYSGGEAIVLDARPAYGSLAFAAGAQTDPATMQVQAGGPDMNSVIGMGCVGYITNAAPTAAVEYGGGGERLSLFVTAQEGMDDPETMDMDESVVDLTLLARRPNGEWICNDDYDGFNPAVMFESPEAGTYQVWVGTYGEGPTRAATLSASGNEPPVSEMHMEMEGEHMDH